MPYKIIASTLLAVSLTTTSVIAAEGAFGPQLSFGTSNKSMKKRLAQKKEFNFNVTKEQLAVHKEIERLIKEGYLKEANTLAKNSFQEIIGGYGKGVPLALALVHMGETSKLLGNFNDAKRYHNRAYLIFKKYKVKNTMDYALAAPYIADTMIYTGFLNEADKYSKAAKVVIKNNFPKTSKAVADMEMLRGKVYAYQENMRKGSRVLYNAQRIYSKLFGDQHIFTAKSHLALGNLNQNAGNFLDSLIEYKKALKILEPVVIKNRPNHYILAEIYSAMGLSYIGEYKYELAIENFEKSMEIFKKEINSKNKRISFIYSYMSMAYKNNKDYDLAIESALKSVDILKEINENKETVEIAELYSNIGGIYVITKDNEKALHYLTEALRINTKYHGKYHTTTKIIRANIKFINNQVDNEW